MKTYISILKGINVSGRNRIKMDELKTMYKTLGFTDVKTYIQSGNVVFKAAKQDTVDMESDICNLINKKLGYNVKVLVMTPDKLRKIIKAVPFSNMETSKLHVTFLSNIPSDPPIDEILNKKFISESAHIAEEAVYLHCPDGYRKTKLSNSFLETKLKVMATTRNWKTVNKLLELANTDNLE